MRAGDHHEQQSVTNRPSLLLVDYDRLLTTRGPQLVSRRFNYAVRRRTGGRV
jgi:hypothetical protein